MRLYLDTEFNEFGGKLISMALVPAQETPVIEPEFYEVIELREPPGPWVSVNVMPKLGKRAIPPEVFQMRLQTYLWTVTGPRRKGLTIVADWPDDFKYLMAALILGPGQALQTPSPFTMELRRDLSSDKSAMPHNALHDARALRDADRS